MDELRKNTERMIVDKILKFLRNDQYRNETGAKCFLDLTEDQYDICLFYDKLTIKYLDKESNYKTLYTFDIWSYYIDYEDENRYYNILSIFSHLTMLIMYIDKYFDAINLDNKIIRRDIKKKYTTNVHKI